MNREKFVFSDLTYGCEVSFLDTKEYTDDLKEVAKQRGLVLPSPDISVFRCIYAFANKKNLNGCTLLSEDVISALDTLRFKEVDFEHNREFPVGVWLDARLEDDKIIAFGAFWKSTFGEDYERLQEKFKVGEAHISFEAWGEREMTGPYSYNLKNVHFCGGGILLENDPAFPGAGIVELAKKHDVNYVMEFASVMTGQATKIEKFEESKLFRNDIDTLFGMVGDVECPSCKEKYVLDLRAIDLDKYVMVVECNACQAKYKIDFDPKLKLTKKANPEQLKWIKENKQSGLQDVRAWVEFYKSQKGTLPNQSSEMEDKEFALVEAIKTNKGKEHKIRLFPINDISFVESSYNKLGNEEVKNTLKKLGVSIESVEKEIIKRAKELKMDDLLKRHNGGNETMAEEKKIDELKEQVITLTTKIEALETENADIKKKKDELEKAQTDAAKANEDIVKERDELKAKVDAFEAEKAQKEKEARDTQVKEIKDKFGDLAQGYQDEELLDPKVQELLDTKKKLADIEANPKVKEALEISGDKKDKKEDPDYLKRRREINKAAFGKKSDI